MGIKIPSHHVEVQIPTVLEELQVRLSLLVVNNSVDAFHASSLGEQYGRYAHALYEFAKDGFTIHRGHARNDGCYSYFLEKEIDDKVICVHAEHTSGKIWFSFQMFRGQTQFTIIIDETDDQKCLGPKEVVAFYRELRDKLWLWPTRQVYEQQS